VATEYSGSGDSRRTIELLWGVGERPRRGPKPRLSVAGIARVAIEIADRDGLGGLSMRRVADEVGVTAMSLYGYLPGKAELLDVMADRVYGELATSPEAGEPGAPGDAGSGWKADGRAEPGRPVEPGGGGERSEAGEAGGWRAGLEGVARRNRGLYLAHPWLLQVAVGRPLLGPNMTAKYDRELATIDGLGLGDVEMDLVISLVNDYVRGAVRGAVEAAQAQAQTGMSDQEWWESYGPLLGEVLDPDRFPTAVRVGAAAGAEYDAAYDPARSFEFGLQRILDGIEAFVADHRP
jgi:AcrR family transcriptional regulator